VVPAVYSGGDFPDSVAGKFEPPIALGREARHGSPFERFAVPVPLAGNASPW